MNTFKNVDHVQNLPLILDGSPGVFYLFPKSNLMSTILNILQFFCNTVVHLRVHFLYMSLIVLTYFRYGLAHDTSCETS